MTCPDTINFTLSFESGDTDGWAVCIHSPLGDLYLNGDEHTSIGYKSADEALAGISKWCVDRGFEPPPPIFLLTAKRRE